MDCLSERSVAVSGRSCPDLVALRPPSGAPSRQTVFRIYRTMAVVARRASPYTDRCAATPSPSRPQELHRFPDTAIGRSGASSPTPRSRCAGTLLFPDPKRDRYSSGKISSRSARLRTSVCVRLLLRVRRRSCYAEQRATMPWVNEYQATCSHKPHVLQVRRGRVPAMFRFHFRSEHG